jgi:hypothetical protein
MPPNSKEERTTMPQTLHFDKKAHPPFLDGIDSENVSFLNGEEELRSGFVCGVNIAREHKAYTSR